MKKFNNIDSQIELLKSRNLRILNEEKAKENLKLYGYYEIVNGYKNLLLKDYLSKYPEDKNMLLTEIGVPPTIIEFDLEEIFDVTLY